MAICPVTFWIVGTIATIIIQVVPIYSEKGCIDIWNVSGIIWIW